MMWDDWNNWDDDVSQPQEEPPPDSPLNFDFLSLLSKPKVQFPQPILLYQT